MLLQETGADYENKIVRPITRTRIRDNAVYYEAISLFSTSGMNFNSGYLKVLKEILIKEDLHLKIC